MHDSLMLLVSRPACACSFAYLLNIVFATTMRRTVFRWTYGIGSCLFLFDGISLDIQITRPESYTVLREVARVSLVLLHSNFIIAMQIKY
jgi:hypothetical protein